jgi:hypothetical protein
MELIAMIRNKTNGITFAMRLVRQGEAYGRNNCLTHDQAEPLVEFYDTRYRFESSPAGTMLGQFTGGRYNLSTLLQHPGAGLCLHGGVAEWTVDRQAFLLAQDLLTNWTAR